MYLELEKQSLCLAPFRSDNLPSFVLVTGLNGAGKTQLLEHIRQGGVARTEEGMAIPKERILLRNQLSMTPDKDHSTGEESAQLMISVDTAWRSYCRMREQFYYEHKASGIGQDDGRFLTYMRLVSNGGLGIDPSQVAEALGKDILSLDNNDFAKFALRASASGGIFQPTFRWYFSNYTSLWQQNELNRAAQEPHLSTEEFDALYGPPPWQLVNSALGSIGVDFYFAKPSLSQRGPIEPQFLSKPTHAPIRLNELSSGEKILVSLAFAIFTTSLEVKLRFPDLVLLDEVDAPLHPAMAKLYIRILRDVFVGQCGLRVIATTHSPSTIALAPEGSVYLMQKGRPGIMPVTRSEALNALTDGVPILAIDFQGRRQVFVESMDDAETYSALYTLLKARLKSDRSLEFIGTGVKGAGEGCDQVKRLVKDLSERGNHSVYGLVDHDAGKNKASDRIIIAALGRRDGIENILLDPLVLAAFICHSHRRYMSAIGLEESFTFRGFCESEPTVLQKIVRRVELATFTDDAQRTVECSYLGGFSLALDERCLLMDDHEFENRIKDAFPELKQYTGAGKLLQRIVGTVGREVPEFLPSDIEATFKQLLEAPSHR